MGCHSLLQGIFPTLGSNLDFLLCRQILYCLNHQGSSKMQSVSCSLSPWNSPSNNTEKGSHSLLQKIFPTQGLNLGLLHCRHIFYPLSLQGCPSSAELVLVSPLVLAWHLRDGHAQVQGGRRNRRTVVLCGHRAVPMVGRALTPAWPCQSPPCSSVLVRPNQECFTPRNVCVSF